MSDSPRKRIKHFDGQGHARELTFSCFQRRPYFSEPSAYEWFFKALAKARNRLPIHVWAYVVMPEHVHLLVWPVDREFKISKLLETLKTSVAKRAGNNLRRNNPASIQATNGEFQFWQSGLGYDRNFDNEATIWAAIDYIHLNPVRRSLCVSAHMTGRGRVPAFSRGNQGYFRLIGNRCRLILADETPSQHDLVEDSKISAPCKGEDRGTRQRRRTVHQSSSRFQDWSASGL